MKERMNECIKHSEIELWLQYCAHFARRPRPHNIFEIALPHSLVHILPCELNHTNASNASVFFPRASERRVLPIVGVCKTSSHLYICSSSHLLILHPLIFTSSYLHIFTSARLHIFSSSHLLIFKSSHPHIFSSCPLALSFFSISLLKAGGRGSANETARNATLSHEMRFDRQKLG